MKVPKFQLSTQSLDAAKEGMEQITEHVAAIKRDHGDEVGKPKQDVDPHHLKTQVCQEQQHIRPQ